MMATGQPDDPLPVNGVESPKETAAGEEVGVVNSDDEVRQRTKSSVSRTDPHSRLTPPSSRTALEKLKQKIDFNDEGGAKVTEATSWTAPSFHPPSKPHPSHSAVTLMAPALTKTTPTEATPPSNEPAKAESPDIDNSVSVSAILSRLDTVRGYIDDAEQLYEQLQEQSTETDCELQLQRVGGLISQLKQQELSYLQVLLKIMEDAPSDDESASESEEDEDDDIAEGIAANESLSLRDELTKKENGEENDDDDEESILALQEQHRLLRKLVEQQQQMELLQAKQAHLLSLKKDAEARLALVEKERDNLEEAVGTMPDSSHVTPEKEREEHLLTQLEEMKERKAQVEQLLSQIQSIKNSPPAQETIPVTEENELSTSEMVSDLNELQSKVKLFENTREQLKGLRSDVAHLQRNDDGLLLTRSAPQLTVNNDQSGILKKTASDPAETTGVTDVLAQYETNISQRLEELKILKEQRDELKRVEAMLLNLQMLTSHQQQQPSHLSTVQSKLEQELSHQRELYSALMKKTSQLQQLQQDIERLTHGSDQESGGMVDDTTGATWGGSSHISDDSQGDQKEELDMSHDSLEHSTATIENDSNTPAVLNYRVDRHTSRQPHPLTQVTTAEEKQIKFGAAANTWSTTGNEEAAVRSDVILKDQLAHSKAMCSQLMDQQSLLLSALHQRLDALPYIHEQLVQLQQYHSYLQGYNDYLNNAYWQLSDYQKTMLGDEPIMNEQEGTANDSFVESLVPPPPFPDMVPYSLGQVNSPFKRPANPHLLATPQSTLRPLSKQEQRVSVQNQSVQFPENVEIETTQDITGSASSLPISSSEKHAAVFESLRDTIYSEVAAVIAQNEERPHFLIELFRELQCLDTDYLRQRALYSLQDIVSRFLTEEVQDKASNKRSNSARFDYVEPVESASSLSTPPLPEEPFAQEQLGDTVIKCSVDDTPLKGLMSGGSSDLDTSALDEKIKIVMTEIIPLMKSHLNDECSQSMMDNIQQSVLDLVLQGQEIQSDGDLRDLFVKQLELSLNAALKKYAVCGKKVSDVGEDLLVSVSEVLFNELAYYQLLKDQGDVPNEWKPMSSVMSPQRPLDPAMLQAFNSALTEEEEENLGNVRDDELAQSWLPPIQAESPVVGNGLADCIDDVVEEEGEEPVVKAPASIVLEADSV